MQPSYVSKNCQTLKLSFSWRHHEAHFYMQGRRKCNFFLFWNTYNVDNFSVRDVIDAFVKNENFKHREPKLPRIILSTDHEADFVTIPVRGGLWMSAAFEDARAQSDSGPLSTLVEYAVDKHDELIHGKLDTVLKFNQLFHQAPNSELSNTASQSTVSGENSDVCVFGRNLSAQLYTDDHVLGLAAFHFHQLCGLCSRFALFVNKRIRALQDHEPLFSAYTSFYIQ